jgi:predicted nuclease of predicted toxin-antitoxin system
MLDADDSPIWGYALEKGAAIVTKDEDFPHRLSQSDKPAPAIVWLRISNTRRSALLA